MRSTSWTLGCDLAKANGRKTSSRAPNVKSRGRDVGLGQFGQLFSGRRKFFEPVDRLPPFEGLQRQISEYSSLATPMRNKMNRTKSKILRFQVVRRSDIVFSLKFR